MNQLDLLEPIAERFEDLPRPTISYQDAFLNYASYQEPVRHGLCSFNDDDKPEMQTVQRITLPLSSGIKQTVERYGMKSVEPYTIYAWDKEDTVEKIILGFLDRKVYHGEDSGKQGSETEAGKWLIEHMQELYEARLYYRAAIKAQRIQDLEEKIKTIQEQIRIENINLGIAVREAREGDTITGEARKILARELGASERDLRI